MKAVMADFNAGLKFYGFYFNSLACEPQTNLISLMLLDGSLLICSSNSENVIWAQILLRKHMSSFFYKTKESSNIIS